MAQDDLLSQDEIDALLKGVSGEEESGSESEAQRGGSRIRPYDPATQHRIIRERLHALDIINERFARQFRMSLFNLLRRSADITVEAVRYQSYSDFSRHVPVPTNINLISMKPLRGTALVLFPPNLVFMVVDNLFGGDGRFLTKSEGREFTHTEQRIIQRLLRLAIDAYQDAWKSVYPLEIGYTRSEMQVKFANITSSPNEIVVTSTFHLEVGNLSSNFQICMPYSMIEPIRDLLSGPLTDSNAEEDRVWGERMADEVKESQIELVANFVDITTTLGRVMSLKSGDVLPIELPDIVTTSVDGVPVMQCEYGSQHGQRALRVRRLIDHVQSHAKFAPGPSGVKESEND
ncbi:MULTISPECIES: flagellar motor switch protein FliM [Modicisalibacter]|uniref:Flagellar motor switch protein FliM n=1 Tax=Modicisalibacter tunisiensis TaxID=390637 RepID=A0ABS7X067_9GAMM|nr:MULTISPECIES: flagellar motor switch protein FliM [Modicisalibacter]MBZ9538311.1 flagellar motor switch protein FliM [Modicisalibacter tunisiensis]MBZ9568277.1 flagellar motor switch protein FliM [Modicisalibacter tunisiensis]